MVDQTRLAEARKAARAWMEAYGIRTEPYTRSGGDHPMMDTLPEAFLAFAALRQSQSPDRDAGEGMREACAQVAERWIIPPALPDAPSIIHERVNRQNQVVPEIAAAIRALPLSPEGKPSC